MTLYRKCPVCDSQTGMALGTLAYALFDDAEIASEYDVTCCSSCGFVAINTPSTQEMYDRFYADSFYSPEYLKREISEGEKAYFSETGAILSRHMDKSRELYDIGCGVGYLFDEVKRFGFTHLFGIDPSLQCVTYLNGKDGVTAEVGELVNLPFADKPLVNIVLSHIVEHLIEVPEALENLSSRMEDGGRVFVEVPDANRYEEFGCGKPLSFFYFQHSIHFSALHLRNLFARFGFQVIAQGGRNREERGFTMPALWAVFEKREADEGLVVPDFSLAERVAGWFAHSTLDPTGEIAELAQQQTPVWLWGIGIHAQMMLAMSPLRQCNIVGLLDANSALHAKSIQGRRIISSSHLAEVDNDSVVFITALVHGERMIQYLRDEIGFSGRIMKV